MFTEKLCHFFKCGYLSEGEKKSVVLVSVVHVRQCQTKLETENGRNCCAVFKVDAECIYFYINDVSCSYGFDLYRVKSAGMVLFLTGISKSPVYTM